jgi:MFS family permease
VSSPGRLPPVVKSLGAVSFFNDLASEMIYPLIPALVTRTLGGGAISLGLFDGISELGASLAKLWAGWLADHPRWRRPLVIGGYLVAAVTRPVIGATSAAWQVIALRATDRIGKGIRTPPRDAVIADATAPEMRGRAFGFHRAMDHAGAVVGPLLAWVLLSIAGLTPDGVIVWSVVPGVIAVGVAAWALRASRGGGTAGSEGPTPAADPVTADRPRSSRLVFSLVVLFAFARFPETLLLLRLQDLRLPVALVPLVWAALHVIRTFGSYPGGKLADAVGPRRVMLAGWGLYALVCVGLATAPTALAGVAWFLVFGFVAALTESPERAFVAAFAGGRGSGSRFGVYHASVGVAILVGGLAFGMAYAQMGGPVALALSAVASGALALGLLVRQRT